MRINSFKLKRQSSINAVQIIFKHVITFGIYFPHTKWNMEGLKNILSFQFWNTSIYLGVDDSNQFQLLINCPLFEFPNSVWKGNHEKYDHTFHLKLWTAVLYLWLWCSPNYNFMQNLVKLISIWSKCQRCWKTGMWLCHHLADFHKLKKYTSKLTNLE